MPPISELTAASELSGTSGSIAPDGVKEGTRSSSIGGGATRSLGATGRPHREHRQVPQRSLWQLSLPLRRFSRA